MLSCALTLGLVLAPAALASRPPLDIRVFARVPNPGQPEPVAVGPDRRIYVGTNQQANGDSAAPSVVFVFSRAGRLRDAIELRRQRLDQSHGIQGLAFDGEGRLYALDRSAAPRVVRINLNTGRQRDFALFRDVPSCSASGRSRNCSATTGDLPAAPDYAAFAPDGHLYVTDIDQALIWRVPPDGGRPQVWFTDPRLESIFGPNGIQVMGGWAHPRLCGHGRLAEQWPLPGRRSVLADDQGRRSPRAARRAVDKPAGRRPGRVCDRPVREDLRGARRRRTKSP